MAANSGNDSYREFERAGWERAAGSYADSFEAATRLFSPQLLEAAAIGKDLELLDVACGTGYVAAMAASHGAAVIGIDFSPNMVAAATKQYPMLLFRVADAEDLPFSDSTFDAAVISFGVHHFPSPIRALSEARRVLRVGGRLAFTVWATPEENAIQGIVVDAIRKSGNVAAALPVPPSGPVSDIATCLRLLHESGFKEPGVQAKKIDAQLHVDSAQNLIDMFAEGTVATSAMIRSQPRERAAAIRAAVEQAITKYATGVRFRIPATAILAFAGKF